MKILVVDDSRAMRMIVLRTLRQAGYGDHKFVEASNGVEALKTIATEHPDLVLSDWNMPEMNGFDLLKTLREKGAMVKFGFVTSEANADIKKLAIESGAAFLLTKPFTTESVQEALRPLMTR
jgi:two-component system, chemotaxis family, chemotaxis protein CheY